MDRGGAGVPEKVLLIEHMDDGRQDRVARHLSQRGFALHWCSPSRGDALPAADQYAVGVILYEAVSGVLPHKADSAHQLVLVFVERPRPDLWVELDRAVAVAAHLHAVGDRLRAGDRLHALGPRGPHARGRIGRGGRRGPLGVVAKPGSLVMNLATCRRKIMMKSPERISSHNRWPLAANPWRAW